MIMYDIRIYFLLFISYAFIGWIIEIINEIMKTHKFVNRGFLIGPYLPIYGYGGLFITLLLTRYSSEPLTLFILAIVICSLLEYYTSYFMEKLFNARWWDYSNRKFNINGRICLETMIPFGLLGLLMIYVINPFIINFYSSLNQTLLTIISSTLFIIFLIDNIISFNVLNKVKNEIKKVDLDNTEEITKKVKETILSTSWIRRRISKAFPNVRYIRTKIKSNIENTLTRERAKQERIRVETEAKIEKIKIESEYRIQELKNRAEKRIKKLNK